MNEKLSIVLGIIIGAIALVLGIFFDFFWWTLYFVVGLIILGLYWITTGRFKK